jgi:multidrug efflux pump subunit AcrA (membrane-fusion protein)
MNAQFEQSIVLQQSPVWSRTIVWSIISVTALVTLWASVFQIEEAVPATGKLEPQGTVKEIKVPVDGVISAIYVKDGQQVKKGETLLHLDATTAQAQVSSLNQVRTALKQENQFYRSQLNGTTSTAETVQQIIKLKLPSELASLTKDRAALLAENALYQAQLQGTNQGLSPSQQSRLQANLAELNSRLSVAQLTTEQTEKQLQQTQIKLASAAKLLQVNQRIYRDMEPIAREGAISRVQLSKQQQDVESRRAEVEQLAQEQQRLQLEVAQSQEKVQNAIAQSKQELLTKIADNEKKLAEIDSQLMKAIVENNQRIAETESKLSQAKQMLAYQELKAPVDGTVFELKAHASGYVANSAEPILKVVPNDALVAKVTITNKDIGFVKEGVEADIKVDSFSFSEFGDVKGKLVWIGSDALPPDQLQPYYKFPAKVQIERQSMMINGREMPLQSGMSVTTHIKLRKRTIMSIFTDAFWKKLEGFQFMR